MWWSTLHKALWYSPPKCTATDTLADRRTSRIWWEYFHPILRSKCHHSQVSTKLYSTWVTSPSVNGMRQNMQDKNQKLSPLTVEAKSRCNSKYRLHFGRLVLLFEARHSNLNFGRVTHHMKQVRHQRQVRFILCIQWVANRRMKATKSVWNICKLTLSTISVSGSITFATLQMIPCTRTWLLINESQNSSMVCCHWVMAVLTSV